MSPCLSCWRHLNSPDPPATGCRTQNWQLHLSQQNSLSVLPPAAPEISANSLQFLLWGLWNSGSILSSGPVALWCFGRWKYRKKEMKLVFYAEALSRRSSKREKASWTCMTCAVIREGFLAVCWGGEEYLQQCLLESEPSAASGLHSFFLDV